FAFLPIVADLMLIRQDTLLGNLHGAIAQAGDGATAMHALVDEVARRIDAPVIAGLGHRFILTAMLWGSFFALIIDRQLRRAALFIALAGCLTLFGVMHSAAPAGEMYWPWAAPSAMAHHWAAGYFAMALLMLALSFGRKELPAS